MTISTILVCLDGSESSTRASDYAIEMAKKYDSEVILLYVVVSHLGYAYSSGEFGNVMPGAIGEILEKSKQEAKKWFEGAEKKAAALNIKIKSEIIATGNSVVPAIVDYADNNKVDLIITGTKGRSGFAKLLLGSVASGVVTYATCPVMIVK